MTNPRTIERILLAAAMLGTVVSVFSAGQWFALWTGSAYTGFMLAVVVDVGMFAAILASRRDRAALWIVGGLATVSWAANAQHALLVHNAGAVAGTAEWMALDLVTLLNALVVTAVAPVAALALAMLYHRSAARGEPTIPAAPPTTRAADVPQPPAAAPAPKRQRTKAAPAGQEPDSGWPWARAYIQEHGELPPGYDTNAALARALDVNVSTVGRAFPAKAATNGAAAH